MQTSERPTIMDGKVIDFAPEFEDHGPGITGRNMQPAGAYHVSASRNAVVVHRAQLTGHRAVAAFIEAVQAAHAAAIQLKASDRGDFGRGELPPVLGPVPPAPPVKAP